MCIRLMAHVPDKPVFWCVEDIMHRDREFDRSEACSRMPAYLRTGVDYVLPRFIRDGLQVLDTMLAEVRRRIYLVQKAQEN